jgi:SH3-like domain-containing protein
VGEEVAGDVWGDVPLTAKESDADDARIARVKLLSEAQPAARSVGQLARNEEVVYLGEAQGRYPRVRSADLEGWVDQALLGKP